LNPGWRSPETSGKIRKIVQMCWFKLQARGMQFSQWGTPPNKNAGKFSSFFEKADTQQVELS
jgi:hypothetical protein